LKKDCADSKIEEHLAIPGRKRNTFIENIGRIIGKIRYNVYKYGEVVRKISRHLRENWNVWTSVLKTKPASTD
jgi:hypothetical protein